MPKVTFDPQNQSEAFSPRIQRNVILGGFSPSTDEKPLSFMYLCSLQIHSQTLRGQRPANLQSQSAIQLRHKAELTARFRI